MRTVAAGLAALGAGVLLGTLVGVGTGSNWNTTDNSYKAGDSNVWFNQCAMQANTHDAFHANDSHDIEPTDITTSLSAAHDACDTVDVRINDFGYGTNRPRGFYECHVFNSPQNCDEGHAHINTSYSAIPENYNETLEVVCEEIGHSVGLDHSDFDSSCMSNDVNARHLDGHDQGHLDDHY